MIDQNSLSLEWIRQVSKQNRNADKILVEKIIRAFLLLEGLVQTGISFVFKGGTSLILHFEKAKRLSIDVDIIIENSIPDLDKVLETAAKAQGFIRVEEQERKTNSKIHKEHYKFFYEPLHNTGRNEENILLDILVEKVHYKRIEDRPIQSAFIPQIGEPAIVKIPSIDDLIADKLTAFAPNTTGVPYFKGKDSMSLEIIKQLYDIGSLFDYVSDIAVVKETFRLFAKTELLYRGKDTPDTIPVLDDILQTSLCISTRGEVAEKEFQELQSGVKRIKNFIFSESYQIEKAIVHASKAAYLATVIKYNLNNIVRFENPAQVTDWTIQEPLHGKLNSLKKANPEAFFYWYKTHEIIANA